MTTSERIAAAIKPILDEDRRADRVRIAELERDRAHYASPDTQKSIADLSQQLRAQLIELDVVHRRNAEKTVTIEKLNKQLDELTEKCAALVVERDAIGRELGESRRALAEEFKASQRAKPETATLRIDTDMSDPQPGKLLVVRLDVSDVDHMKADTHPTVTLGFFRHQFVGFLVETPAVEVK